MSRLRVADLAPDTRAHTIASHFRRRRARVRSTSALESARVAAPTPAATCRTPHTATPLPQRTAALWTHWTATAPRTRSGEEFQCRPSSRWTTSALACATASAGLCHLASKRPCVCGAFGLLDSSPHRVWLRAEHIRRHRTGAVSPRDARGPLRRRGQQPRPGALLARRPRIQPRPGSSRLLLCRCGPSPCTRVNWHAYVRAVSSWRPAETSVPCRRAYACVADEACHCADAGAAASTSRVGIPDISPVSSFEMTVAPAAFAERPAAAPPAPAPGDTGVTLDLLTGEASYEPPTRRPLCHVASDTSQFRRAVRAHDPLVRAPARPFKCVARSAPTSRAGVP